MGDDATRSTFIGGLFTLVGLSLTLLFDKSRRRNTEPPSTEPARDDPDEDDETLDRLLAEMTRRAERAEQRLEVAELQQQVCREAGAVLAGRVAELREWLITAGCNPDTGQRRARPTVNPDEDS